MPSLAPIFCKDFDFTGIFSLNFIVVIFAFLFVDMFDTIGTLIGVSSKANMLDENGKVPPRIKGALLADAVGNYGRRTAWYFYYHDIRRECIRRIRRRKNRPYGSDYGDPVWTCPVPVANLPRDSFFRDSAGSGSRRILYAD